jgi:hypothetical protein
MHFSSSDSEMPVSVDEPVQHRRRFCPCGSGPHPELQSEAHTESATRIEPDNPGPAHMRPEWQQHEPDPKLVMRHNVLLREAKGYWDRGEELPADLRKRLLQPVTRKRLLQPVTRKPRTMTRPRTHRSPRRGGAKTAQDPGDDPDPDPDPIELRIRELVDQAPTLSIGQQRRLRALLGGA